MQQGEVRMDEGRGEIIIVRRGGNGGDDSHHGGTWKIAYADFMTAMMAFFLVMWLVNATSEETKASIAAYFNPIRLVDEQPQPKGLEENDIEVDAKKSQDEKNSYNASQSKTPSLTEEAHLLESPYGTLETIVLLEHGETHKQKNGDKENNQAEGSAFRDPFSPHYWDEVAALEEVAEFEDLIPISGHDQDKNENEARPLNEADIAASQAQQQIIATLRNELNHLMQEIVTEHALEHQPNLHIAAHDEGVLIELTDNQNYGMFAIGSAKPKAEIVLLLEGMAKILATHSGEVIISGYTDRRPYRNPSHYDNWQLATARAQMAYYMLMRGGLDEMRVLRVEGYADRALKNAEDPYAAENRRIAIFLKMPGGSSSFSSPRMKGEEEKVVRAKIPSIPSGMNGKES